MMNFDKIINSLREAGKSYEEIAQDITDSMNKAKTQEQEKKSKENEYIKKLNQRKADLLSDIANKKDTLNTYAELGAIAIALDIKDKRKLDDTSLKNLGNNVQGTLKAIKNMVVEGWDIFFKVGENFW